MLTLSMNSDQGLEAELADLRRRLQLLEDERELRTLLATYAFCADTGRSREWVDLFTDDGAVDLGETVHAMSGGQAPVGYSRRARFQGHEELLLDFITALPHRRVENRSAHHTTSGPLTFDIDGDDAVGRGYSVMVVRTETGFGIEMTAMNRWIFRRVEGRWRIVERRMRPIGSSEAAQVLHS
jgi:hypothetical protein